MRVARRVGSIFVATVLGSTMSLMVAGPAFADEGTPPTPPPACATTSTTLATPCSAAVTSSGGTYTVTVPGVGTVTFNLTADGTPTSVVATPASGFTAGTPDVDGERVSVTFTNTSNPEQSYTVTAKAKDEPGPTTTVVAVVHSRPPDEGDHHEGDDGSHETPPSTFAPQSGEHHFGGDRSGDP